MPSSPKNMASLNREVNPTVNIEALKSDIRAALINDKSFACPIAMRVAWHASGTFDKSDGSGGSDGARMRFEPEKSDDANAGLHIIRDMLLRVHKKYPNVSQADLWTYAGVCAVEFMGGPKCPFRFGRTDDVDGAKCPMNGRLPDATQGAQHLRDVFYRMGFDDEGIVALSGGHTVGRCHLVRSGFDGPWTTNSLKFDNEYFVNLLNKKWKKVTTPAGREQFADEETGELMMLPTDICMLDDAGFRPFVEKFANSQSAFFDSFAKAYGKLLALGCPKEVNPITASNAPVNSEDLIAAQLRERAMHGSLEFVQKLSKQCDPSQLEASTGRNALHKAAFWGHEQTVEFLLNECKVDPNIQDKSGDTALHDAARFGHTKCVDLLKAVSKQDLKNNEGATAKELAVEHGYAF